MFTLIDAITAGFLGAIDAGQQALAVFALPILAICALISYYREYSATVMSSGAGLGDYLAHALLLIFATGCYMFVLLQLLAIAQAALDTVFFWGLLGAGGGVSSAQLNQPSFIFEAGRKTAKPIAAVGTRLRGDDRLARDASPLLRAEARPCPAALRSAQSAAPQHRVFQHPANVSVALLLRHVPH